MAEGMKDGIRTVLNKRESKRLGKDVYSYKVPYRTLDGRQTSETFDTLKKAKEFRDGLRNNRHAGIVRDLNAGRASVRDYFSEWLVNNMGIGRGNTDQIYRSRIINHIIPHLGNKRMREVSPRDMQRFVSALTREGLMPRTVHGIWQTTKKIFNHAHKVDGIIGTSPCVGVILPEVPDHEMTLLTWEEIRELADKWMGVQLYRGRNRGMQDRRYRAAVILAGGTGLRVSEVAGLTWGDIDFTNRRITVERQMTRAGLFAPPKSKRSKRTVPFSKAVAVALEQHREEFPPVESRIGWVKSKRVDRVELLFMSRLGKPATSKSLGDSFSRACANAGHDGVSFHTLRHSFASASILAGLTILELRDVMGHSSVTITGDVYGHLFPNTDSRVRGLFDDAFD